MSTSQPPGGDGAAFDPYTQNVTFLGPDGVTPIAVPIPEIDSFDDTTVAVTINYSIQIGCCIITLLVLLTMTRPLVKLRRVSSMLYAFGLATCIVRNSIFVAFFMSPLNHFYQSFAGDYSNVSRKFIANSIAGDVMSCLLVLIVEAALMNQAWTTVRLWSEPIRALLVLASGVIVLVAVAFRIGFLVVQARANVDLLAPGPGDQWAVQGSLITLAISIFWFCALFNLKLVGHLITNWGVLPSMRTLTSMEVLIMTNGILMIIPAVFAGLEWGTFQNFESQSLVAASVIILLPIGTLIAQQISARSFAGPGPDYWLCTRSDCSCACHHSTRGDTVTATGGKTMRTGGTAATRTADSDGDRASSAAHDEKHSFLSAFRLHSFSSPGRHHRHHHDASAGTSPTSTTVSASRHDDGDAEAHHPPDQFDVELRQIDSESDLGGDRPPYRRDSGYPGGGEGRDGERDVEKGV
ncbi:hypothetical protein PLIIFM63780_010540 [Purpureocillium lilacinum]|nr:hypothetical protein PLIIFM63780_010540 [Purpureocillium lilacinum]